MCVFCVFWFGNEYFCCDGDDDGVGDIVDDVRRDGFKGFSRF